MKTELRAKPHGLLPGVTVFELWWNGYLIGEITGADGSGVRVISKYPMTTRSAPLVTEVVMAV